MLKHIHLENFKAQQATDLDFSKINVLTGFNSTGKTTVIQSLAFVKQSLQKKAVSYTHLGWVSSICGSPRRK